MAEAASNAPTLIKEELARRRMSRASLADAAKISLSALEKGLSGQRKFSEAALLRVEAVLDIDLHTTVLRSAADELGGYARATVAWLEGNYLTLRPSSKRLDDIVAYLTTIEWSEEAGHLTFRENARMDRDYAQKGSVAVPHQSGHIYLVTNRHGQHRLMTLSRQGVTGALHGLLLTLQQERGASLRPVSMPIVMLPAARLKDAPALGVISPAHPAHERLRGLLDATLDGGFAVMLR